MKHDASHSEKKTWNNPLIESTDSWPVKIIKDCISYALGIPWTQKINKTLKDDFQPSLLQLFEQRNIDVDIYGDENIAKLDLTKPIAIMQNHPHGILDAMLAAYLCEKKLHQNYRGFANRILKEVVCFPDSMVIPADNQSSEKNKKVGLNQKALKLSRAQLKSGGILVNSPAGEVSYLRFQKNKFQIIDAPWLDTPFRLAMMTDAQILPVYISGRNSLLFYFVRIFGRLPGRMLLFWEYIIGKNKKIKIIVKQPILGSSISAETLGPIKEQVYNSIYDNNNY